MRIVLSFLFAIIGGIIGVVVVAEFQHYVAQAQLDNIRGFWVEFGFPVVSLAWLIVPATLCVTGYRLVRVIGRKPPHATESDNKN
jgi:hypothetical protein